nr:hypothetical protein [Streptomyces sp. DSM 41633]
MPGLGRRVRLRRHPYVSEMTYADDHQEHEQPPAADPSPPSASVRRPYPRSWVTDAAVIVPRRA